MPMMYDTEFVRGVSDEIEDKDGKDWISVFSVNPGQILRLWISKICRAGIYIAP
jgi:hypothetical protein